MNHSGFELLDEVFDFCLKNQKLLVQNESIILPKTKDILSNLTNQSYKVNFH